jgi:hypothetical protein
MDKMLQYFAYNGGKIAVSKQVNQKILALNVKNNEV